MTTRKIVSAISYIGMMNAFGIVPEMIASVENEIAFYNGFEWAVKENGSSVLEGSCVGEKIKRWV